MIEPLIGFGTSYQFIKAATTAIERRKRIATLASFLATSTSALTTDPATNAAVGGAISAKIAYMRTILDTRGGDTFITYKTIAGLRKYVFLRDSLVNQPSYVIPVLKPYQLEFQKAGEVISQNIFQEHTARRYLEGVSQKMTSVSLVSVSAKEVVKIGPQIGILGILGYSSLALGIGAVGIYCGLNLLREAKNEHGKMMVESKSNQVVIDV